MEPGWFKIPVDWKIGKKKGGVRVREVAGEDNLNDWYVSIRQWTGQSIICVVS